MGYSDSFYVVDNIVGYTGKVNELPTVYFEDESAYGHITQQHKYDWNVGREALRSREGYSTANTDEGSDHVRLLELSGDKVIHESRNEMISLEGMSSGDKAILAQSIWRYTDIKSRYKPKEKGKK